jgi:hypothetical protein
MKERPVSLASKPAAMYAFPLARRVDLVGDVAAQMAARPMGNAEKHLAAKLHGQGLTLRKKGVPMPVVARELYALEQAIRAKLWTLVLCGDAERG